MRTTLVLVLAAEMASVVVLVSTKNEIMVPYPNYTMHPVKASMIADAMDQSRLVKFQIRFYLFTKENANDPQRIRNKIDLKASHFNPKNPTRFLIPGWLEKEPQQEGSILTKIRDQYFSLGRFNIFIVDWSDGNSENYIQSAYNTLQAGSKIGAFIEFLITNGPLKAIDTYIIGFGLGAHVSGITGRHVKLQNINTIIGLDPAKHLFTDTLASNRLTKEDALYVETIQTDIPDLGLMHPIGHASFFPNYGSAQPGCDLRDILDCSHRRAYNYFAASITNPDNFKAVRCSTFREILDHDCHPTKITLRMGGEPSNYGHSSPGVYYLKISWDENHPYNNTTKNDNNIATSTAEYDPDVYVTVPYPNYTMHPVRVSVVMETRLPNRRVQFQIRFYLFTKENGNDPQRIRNKTDLNTSHFNPKNPTRFLIPGWLEKEPQQEESVLTKIRDQYLSLGRFNIFIVDWSDGNSENYIQSVYNTLQAGSEIGAFIEFLITNGLLKANDTYIVGFGLGAHVAGITGKHVKLQKINTIIGLDPAKPLFTSAMSSQLLTKRDALYVETIHTDAGYLGLADPIGHASFYPNYGSHQPGCDDIRDFVDCSHRHAYYYFAESITNPDIFKAMQCSSYNDIAEKICHPKEITLRMGGEPSNYGHSSPGVYYLKIPSGENHPCSIDNDNTTKYDNINATSVVKFDPEVYVMVPYPNYTMHPVTVSVVNTTMQPSRRVQFQIRFYLFTKENANDPQRIRNKTDLITSHFNPKNPTRFLIPGWLEKEPQQEGSVLTKIRDQYLSLGRFNILIVDWSDGNSENYIQSAYNTLQAGSEIGAFIEFLITNGPLKAIDTYIIGFGLGAHVAGITGRHVKLQKINTIIGLDPARPLFTDALASKRLTEGDALYVETIHTSAGFLGLEGPIGHASFYPNYGSHQPQCSAFSDIHSCSHKLAYDYFTASITARNDFLAVQCSSYNGIAKKNCHPTKITLRMGGEPSNYGHSSPGVYYLKIPSDDNRSYRNDSSTKSDNNNAIAQKHRAIYVLKMKPGRAYVIMLTTNHYN